MGDRTTVPRSAYRASKKEKKEVCAHVRREGNAEAHPSAYAMRVRFSEYRLSAAVRTDTRRSSREVGANVLKASMPDVAECCDQMNGNEHCAAGLGK
jgi:hypothetical protein